MNTQGDRVGLIWSIAELLRHDYKPSEYGKVILPFTLLRRLDCCLAPAAVVLKERVHGRPPLLCEGQDRNGYCRGSNMASP
jgi:type I restriction-modification system DNA methylase subunit